MLAERGWKKTLRQLLYAHKELQRNTAAEVVAHVGEGGGVGVGVGGGVGGGGASVAGHCRSRLSLEVLV